LKKKHNDFFSLTLNLCSITLKMCDAVFGSAEQEKLIINSAEIKNHCLEALLKEFIPPLEREDIALCVFMLHSLNSDIASIRLPLHIKRKYTDALLDCLKKTCEKLYFVAENMGKAIFDNDCCETTAQQIICECRFELSTLSRPTSESFNTFCVCSDIYNCIKKALYTIDCFTYVALKNS